MSIPFEIPIINQDVVEGVSYSGTTLTLTRAEGSPLTTTIPTANSVNGVSYSGTTLSLTREEGSPLTTTIPTANSVNGVSYSGTTLSLTREEGSDLTTTIETTGNETKISNGTSKMEIASSNGACVFTPNNLTAKTTTFGADGKLDISEEMTFNSPNGIGQATSFLALPNIKIGSAYMNRLTGATGNFESLMSYTKIGNLLNINGYFVISVPSGTNSGTSYMNLADIGLPTGVNTNVYTITNSDTGSNQISNTVTTDTTNNRLVFNWATSAGIQYLEFKMLLSCGHRASY